MDCIISAGGVPQSDDLLYELTQGRPKALLDLAGKPMVQWVVDALAASPNIDRIVLVGLSEADGLRGRSRQAHALHGWGRDFRVHPCGRAKGGRRAREEGRPRG